jgi:Tfp pilus assembly protein PilV
MKATSRLGFSLLEVVLATGILLGASIVLAELAGIGSRQATSARDLAQAQLLCQSRLNEIVAGVEPLASVQDTPLVDAPGWTCSVETEPTARPNMMLVRVTVSQEEGVRGHPKKFSLERWVSGRGETAAAEMSAADASSVHLPETHP